jgi:hypothetical protein
MAAKYGKVPGPAEWAGYETDLDVRDAHRMLFGKTVQDAATEHNFGGGRAISRMDELLFMPTRAFQYYVFAFAEYLMTGAAKGDPDAASPFLSLLEAREKRDPGSVAQIYEKLAPFVEYVGANQEHFDADQDIYGNFRERADGIRRACKA